MNSIAEINPSIAESVEQAEAIRTSMQMKLDEMRRAYHKAPNPSLAERKEHLKKLKRMIGDNVDEISLSACLCDTHCPPFWAWLFLLWRNLFGGPCPGVGGLL